MHAFPSDRLFRRGAWPTAAKILGLVLLILGSNFWVLRLSSSSLPVFDLWQAEGQHLLQPWLHGQLHLSDLFAPWAQHRIVWTRLLTLALFQLNGQWDTQVEAIAAELIHAGIAALLGLILGRRLGRKREDAILLCLFLLFGLPFAQENILSGGFNSQYNALLLFAVVAIWGLASHRPGSAGWWVGVAGAIAAWFSVATGGLPALAVAAWMGLRLARRDGSRRDDAITLGVALALGAGGLCLSIGVGQVGALQPRSVGEWLIRFLGLLGWPNPTAWTAPVAYAPFAWLVWRTARSRRGPYSTGPAEAFLIPLGFFALLNTAALAYARNRYGGLEVSRYMDFLSVGALVNFACLVLFAREMKKSASEPRLAFGLLATVWVATAGLGLARLTTNNITHDLPLVRTGSEQEVANVAAFVARPDLAGFLHKYPSEIQCEQPAVAAALLQDPRILRILPWQVRLPVDLQAASGTPQVHKIVPDAGDPGEAGWLLEPGHNGQPVYFRSGSIHLSHLPYLRFPQVSGLGDNAIMALVDERSGATTWLVPEKPESNDWHPVLVKTPSGPFHVEVVLAAGANRPLAFANPREVGWLSAWVDTLLDSAVDFLFAGAGLWCAAIFWKRLARRPRQTSAALPDDGALLADQLGHALFP